MGVYVDYFTRNHTLYLTCASEIGIISPNATFCMYNICMKVQSRVDGSKGYLLALQMPTRQTSEHLTVFPTPTPKREKRRRILPLLFRTLPRHLGITDSCFENSDHFGSFGIFSPQVISLLEMSTPPDEFSDTNLTLLPSQPRMNTSQGVFAATIIMSAIAKLTLQPHQTVFLAESHLQCTRQKPLLFVYRRTHPDIWSSETCTNLACLPLFLGGPMGPIHAGWANRQSGRDIHLGSDLQAQTIRHVRYEL